MSLQSSEGYAKPRVLLVDDQVLFRQALRCLLESLHRVKVVAEASDGIEALNSIRNCEPDLVLIEASLSRLSGTDVVRRARLEGSHARFLVVSRLIRRSLVEDVIEAGAGGFLSKSDSTDDLASALDVVCGGRIYLSPAATGHLVDIALGKEPEQSARGMLTSREREVLQLIAEGMSSKEIAQQLDISVRTVESHRSNLMQKLGVHKASRLVRYAIREGLLLP